MAILHVEGDPVDGEPPPGARPSVLGYSGSDGTIAWAWPDRDLMILYFTQSRGGATPIRLEAESTQALIVQRMEAFDEAARHGADLAGRMYREVLTSRLLPVLESIGDSGSVAACTATIRDLDTIADGVRDSRTLADIIGIV